MHNRAYRCLLNTCEIILNRKLVHLLSRRCGGFLHYLFRVAGGFWFYVRRYDYFLVRRSGRIFASGLRRCGSVRFFISLSFRLMFLVFFWLCIGSFYYRSLRRCGRCFVMSVRRVEEFKLLTSDPKGHRRPIIIFTRLAHRCGRVDVVAFCRCGRF